LAITEPFTNFSFTRWILAIMEPFMNFSFTWWNFGYHGAFHELFSWWNSGYHGAFHELFFHTMEFWLSWSLSQTFFMVELTRHMILGETLFIYITKSIYIGSASLKTLPLDLEPPLWGKEYGPPYSKEIVKKVNVLFPKPLIDSWFGFFLNFYRM
jgi:hypothetical protein